jgi:RNA polymerase sigma factor (sigma-70 family)
VLEGCSDRELIERARRGDNAAFGALWGRYERRVAHVCRGYLGRGAPSAARDAAVDDDDLLAGIFIRALHYLDRHEERPGSGGFSAWLMQLTRNHCLTFLATQRRRRQWLAPLDGEPGLDARPDPGPSVARIVEEREMLRLAAQAINALPSRYRAPFRLFLEECSHGEIATALGISIEASFKRIQRARKLLQPQLTELFLAGGPAGDGGRRGCRRAAADVERGWRAVERALEEIVSSYRVVNVTLPGGGDLQLCLRIDRDQAAREAEIEPLRARLAARPRAWKQRLQLAELCYHSGRWSEAQTEYRAVLAARAACHGAALRLGGMLQGEGRPEEAAPVYEAALAALSPGEAAGLPGRLLRANLFLANGADAEAADAFRGAIACAPAEKPGYYGLNTALAHLSRYEEQLENLARLRALDPDDLFAYTAAYTPCARLVRFDLALPLLERAVELDPHHPMALKHLFQVRMNLQLCNEETLAMAERLVRLAPHFVESWGELSWIYFELGRDEESVAVLEQFLAEHPDNAEGLAALAWRLRYLGRDSEALSQARRAYRLAPQRWFVCWTFLSCAAFPSCPEAEAAAGAEEIAARFPQDAFLLSEIAGLYTARQQEERAVDYGRQAASLCPTSPLAWRRLAEAYRAFRRWEEAAEAGARLLALPGTRTCGYLSELAVARHALYDLTADALFEEAASLATTAGEFVSLAGHLEACSRLAAAEDAFRQALVSPGPPQVRRQAEAGLRRLAGRVTQ